MTSALAHLASAVAAALDDPQFAAAVEQQRPATVTSRPATLDATGAAAHLHLPVTTVRQYAREGRLPAFKAGRQWLFYTDDLDRTLRANLLAA